METIEEDMTLGEKEIPDFDHFKKWACSHCNEDWYCPDLCYFLKKAQDIPIRWLQERYTKYDGEPTKIVSAVRNKRVNGMYGF